MKDQRLTTACFSLQITILLFLVGIVSTVLSQPSGNNEPCVGIGTGCSTWVPEPTAAIIILPEFPNCHIEIFYKKRTCSGVDEYTIDKIQYIGALPGDPCRPLYDSIAGGNSQIFERNLYLRCYEFLVTKFFDFEYGQAVINYNTAFANWSADPGNPTLYAIFLAEKAVKQGMECPNGVITKNGAYSTCQTTFTDIWWLVVPGSFGQPDVTYGNFTVRYVPCATVPVCCIRQFLMCRNTSTGLTEITMSIPDPPANSDCDGPDAGWWPAHNPSNQYGLNAGTIISACQPYCMEGPNEPLVRTRRNSPILGAK